MGFQSTVRNDQAGGIIGELAYSGPLRASTAILNSTDADNNVVGRAFSFASGGLESYAGADEASSTFAGILANPKTYALQGTDAGTLTPTLILPNNTQAEFVSMGEIWVNLGAAADVGALVEFEMATGILAPVEAEVIGTGSIATTTLTISAMTSGAFRVGSLISGPNIVPGTRIVALGTGTGGTGTYTVSVSQTAASAQVNGEPLPRSALYKLVPNCNVSRAEVAANGLAVIKLTN